jgi:hypothetical protein
MSLSSAGEPGKEIPTESAPVSPVASDPRTSLESLVHLLQGNSEPSLADVGITALPYDQLDRLSSSALQEAELCQDRSELFLELLECCVESSASPEPETLLRMARQMVRLARDQRRWRDLADNAAYYRDNAQVAARISQYLLAATSMSNDSKTARASSRLKSSVS